MVITCENCGTRFNLDETLLRKDGSKARCSVCRHVFMVFPPSSSNADQEFEQTVALEAPLGVRDTDAASHFQEEDAFDQVLDESLEDRAPSSDLSEDMDFSGMEDIPGDDELLPADAEEPAEEEIFREPEEMDFVPATPKRSAKSKVLLVILIILLLLAGGTAAVVYWAPQMLPGFLSPLKPVQKTTIVDLGVRRLSFKAVTGAFFKSKKAGNLFVIKGTVTNGYPESRRLILIQGTILNDKGDVVRKRVAYAGNTFKEDQMDQMTFAEFDKAMKNPMGNNGNKGVVPPDGSIPFMIVFENLPENLSEFTVEAVSSSPVK